jgi:hypothetical protein
MPITHRYLTDILAGIASLPSEEMVDALRRAPKHMRLLLHSRTESTSSRGRRRRSTFGST